MANDNVDDNDYVDDNDDDADYNVNDNVDDNDYRILTTVGGLVGKPPSRPSQSLGESISLSLSSSSLSG